VGGWWVGVVGCVGVGWLVVVSGWVSGFQNVFVYIYIYIYIYILCVWDAHIYIYIYIYIYIERARYACVYPCIYVCL